MMRLPQHDQTSRLILASSATPFLDGYSTASAAFLISLLPGFSPLEVALFTSLYLVGSFLGALGVGSVTDHWGRRPPYLTLMSAVGIMVAFAAICPSVTGLLVMRLVTGFALGGDYPVSQAMVSEHCCDKVRPQALTFLMLAWYFGALAGVVASAPVTQGTLPWTAILWFQAGIAAVALVLRLGISESPDWLAHKKAYRRLRARSLNSGILAEVQSIFETIGIHKGAVVFCSAFWLCQTIPATIMMLYSPKILYNISGTTSSFVQMLILYGFFLIGTVPAGSRYLLSHPKAVLSITFLTMAMGIFGVFLFAEKSEILTNISFVIFAVSYGLQSPLDFVYPNRLFQTEVRGTLIGVVTSVSRIGAAGAAFTFPLLEHHFAIEILLGCGICVLILGFLIATKWAPGDK